jgi:hypothetical protein
MKVQVELFGDTLIERRLLRWSEHVYEPGPVWDKVKDKFQTSFERAFSQQGPGWAPLKPGTVRQRIAEGYAPGPILTRSGKYRKAMTKELKSHETQNQMILVAPGVPGKFHQKGTRKMAARPLRLAENEKREVGKIIQRWLIEGYTE